MKLPKIISQKEFEQIFEAVEKIKSPNKKEIKAAMLLGFEAGMRISEIVGLANKDKTVIVPALTQDRVEDALIRIEQGKGKKDRIVPRPARFNESYKKILPIKLTRRALQLVVSRLGRVILNKHITFHTLRHGFASHLVNSGRPLHEVQMLLGHSRLDTTGIYLHANPQQAVDGARRVF